MTHDYTLLIAEIPYDFLDVFNILDVPEFPALIVAGITGTVYLIELNPNSNLVK